MEEIYYWQVWLQMLHHNDPAALPKIENATTADKPAKKINNPKEAGDKS